MGIVHEGLEDKISKILIICLIKNYEATEQQVNIKDHTKCINRQKNISIIMDHILQLTTTDCPLRFLRLLSILCLVFFSPSSQQTGRLSLAAVVDSGGPWRSSFTDDRIYVYTVTGQDTTSLDRRTGCR